MEKSYHKKKLTKQDKRRLKVKALLKSGMFKKPQISQKAGVSLSVYTEFRKKVAKKAGLRSNRDKV